MGVWDILFKVIIIIGVFVIAAIILSIVPCPLLVGFLLILGILFLAGRQNSEVET